MEYAPHFQRDELTRTFTGLPNNPNPAAEAQLKALSRILEGIRSIVGKPLYINSAYRSPEVNDAVGGAKRSYHLFGRACDISIRNLDDNERSILRRAIMARKPSEFIKYDTFYHVAFDISRLGQYGGPVTVLQEEYPDDFPVATEKDSSLKDDY